MGMVKLVVAEEEYVPRFTPFHSDVFQGHYGRDCRLTGVETDRFHLN